MSKADDKSAALAVFKANAIAPDRRGKIIEHAKVQLDTLVNHRAQGPYRAIALGMLLHQLKEGCKFGEWMPLYEQILKSSKFVTESTARTYCSQWMRLATEFVVQAEAAKPEYIALAGTGHELAIDSKNATERAFVGKMEKFIDGRSLDELLTDLDLRNAAATKKGKVTKPSAKPPTEAEKAAAVQARFNEIEEALQLARKGATDKGTWMSFDKKQHDALKAIFTNAANEIDEIHQKTHGRGKK